MLLPKYALILNVILCVDYIKYCAQFIHNTQVLWRFKFYIAPDLSVKYIPVSTITQKYIVGT